MTHGIFGVGTVTVYFLLAHDSFINGRCLLFEYCDGL